MATYTGSDKRLQYLFQNGGGGGASALNDLSDVDISSPTDGQALLYDANNQEWVNGTVQGGGGGGGGISGLGVDVLFSGEYYDTSVSQSLSAPYTQYALILVEACAKTTYYHSKSSILIKPSDIQGTGIVGGEFCLGMINEENSTYYWRLRFGFSDTTHIKLNGRSIGGWTQQNSPMITKVWGIRSSDHTYSTTEQVVGTWIDGKPIYEKTVDLGYLANSGTVYVNHNISNIKAVVSLKGIAQTGNGVNIPLPFVSTTSSNCVQLSSNTTQIFTITGSDRSGFYAYAIIQYLKSTD